MVRSGLHQAYPLWQPEPPHLQALHQVCLQGRRRSRERRHQRTVRFFARSTERILREDSNTAFWDLIAKGTDVERHQRFSYETFLIADIAIHDSNVLSAADDSCIGHDDSV